MLDGYIASFATSPLAGFGDLSPWHMTAQAADLMRRMMRTLPVDRFLITDDIAVHRMAHIEQGAVIKGPAIIGEGCFVGMNALLRGGVWLAPHCSVGPGCEVKSSFLFAKARLAHFNFVGDSLLGADVNFEAGSIIANTRNERGGAVRVRLDGVLTETGVPKFGAVVGDGARVGANAVLAPGTILHPAAVVDRLERVDQER
ncbi:MAG: LpxA family transferase [Proteobacteria bacterium]|nr:LpxA family transferase [Pseudomonadota bacterium]